MSDKDPKLTPQQQKIQEIKQLLQAFNVVPNDTNIQMFQQLFDIKNPVQLTVLPQKADVTNLMCLGAVAELTKPFFPEDSEIQSLPQFLYDLRVYAMRSYKGTFVSMFQRIFEQNTPSDIVVPNQLPNVIPQDQPKKGILGRFRGNKE